MPSPPDAAYRTARSPTRRNRWCAAAAIARRAALYRLAGAHERFRRARVGDGAVAGAEPGTAGGGGAGKAAAAGAVGRGAAPLAGGRPVAVARAADAGHRR